MDVTRKRDRDQVVYRATDFKREDRHQLRREYIIYRGRWGTGTYAGTKWYWDGHADVEDSSFCTPCRNASRPIPRVVMVDQLWMHVLGQHTLLTFLPARYGADELNDPSGVGSAIRQTLRTKADLWSVFDLVLVVLEESSMSLLSR